MSFLLFSKSEVQIFHIGSKPDFVKELMQCLNRHLKLQLLEKFAFQFTKTHFNLQKHNQRKDG